MDLEDVRLSEMSDRERQISSVLTYMWELKTKQNWTPRYREQIGC